MNLFALLCASDTPLSEAALEALVGFLIVLAVLALLVGIFYLTGYLFSKTRLGDDKLFARKPDHASKELPPPTTSPEEDEGAVVAAISAAIAAMYADDAASDGETERPDFIVKRKNNSR